MTLLRSLQTALAKVNGNTMLIEDLRGYDEYWCTVGKHYVYEDQYNATHHCCFQCFYSESDRTRADDGDAPEVENVDV